MEIAEWLHATKRVFNHGREAQLSPSSPLSQDDQASIDTRYKRSIGINFWLGITGRQSRRAKAETVRAPATERYLALAPTNHPQDRQHRTTPLPRSLVTVSSQANRVNNGQRMFIMGQTPVLYTDKALSQFQES
ncbi:uncharacterized protein N7458_012706 [Penicillium daleae]|uniref:Uncharacterized protein n=1 Tax=Penicillium daleae TaxID=63821 RepID=A0AAD6BVU2_9EURO|nr:uncharacterized protein N7458_012706 [Penicillium daleae]KAJ5433550.1 hypothetical protein N7458_012706 [Penicillium daleae]